MKFCARLHFLSSWRDDILDFNVEGFGAFEEDYSVGLSKD
jgi:hypothetical protein